MFARAPRREFPLPLELITMIAEELVYDSDGLPDKTRANLLSCRLVSPMLCACATKLLFRELTVTFKDSPELSATYQPPAQVAEDDGYDMRDEDSDATAWAEMESYLDLSSLVDDSDSTSCTFAPYDVAHTGSGYGSVIDSYGRFVSVAPSDSASEYESASLEDEGEGVAQHPRTFQAFYKFILASPHLCGHVKQLKLIRSAIFDLDKFWDPRGDIPESLLLSICKLLPNLKDLILRHLLTQCEDMQGPLPDDQLSLNILHLDMTKRCFCESMLSPLRILRNLKHFIIGPVPEYSSYDPEPAGCHTELELPAVSPTLSLNTLLFERSRVTHKFLETLEKQKSICANVRHLRIDDFEPIDLMYVVGFAEVHQDSLTSLSIDLYVLRVFDDPIPDDLTFGEDLAYSLGPLLKRIRSLAITDEFFYSSCPDFKNNMEDTERTWDIICGLLAALADSQCLETIAIMADEHMGWNWALPPKKYVPVLSEDLEDSLARIDALPLPALRKFSLVTSAPRSWYTRRVQAAFPKLYARGVLTIEEAYPSNVEAVLFDTPPI